MNPDVAQAAARALGSIGNAEAVQAIEAASPVAPAANPAHTPLPGLAARWRCRRLHHANNVAFCEGLICCAEALSAKGDRNHAIVIDDRVLGMDVPHQVRTAALRGAILQPAAGRTAEGLVAAMGEGDFAVFAACTRISQEMPGTPLNAGVGRSNQYQYLYRQILLIGAWQPAGCGCACRRCWLSQNRAKHLCASPRFARCLRSEAPPRRCLCGPGGGNRRCG